jgi:hypothetical protein
LRCAALRRLACSRADIDTMRAFLHTRGQAGGLFSDPLDGRGRAAAAAARPRTHDMSESDASDTPSPRPAAAAAQRGKDGGECKDELDVLKDKVAAPPRLLCCLLVTRAASGRPCGPLPLDAPTRRTQAVGCQAGWLGTGEAARGRGGGRPWHPTCGVPPRRASPARRPCIALGLGRV